MTLRTKSLLIGGLTFAVLTVAFFGAVYYITQNSFTQIETREALGDVSGAIDALRAETENLAMTARDYSRSEQTYEYMAHPDPGYIAENLGPSATANLQIDYALFIAPNGASVSAEGFDAHGGQSRAVPTDLLPSVLPYASGPTASEEAAGVFGLVALEEGPAMIAAFPVLRSNGAGPSRGTLVFVRRVDGGESAKLSRATGLQIEAFPVRGAGSPSDVAAALARMGRTSDRDAMPVSDTRLDAYGVVRGLDRDPAVVLRVTKERPILAQSRIATAYFLIAALVIALVLGGMGYYLLDMQIVRRVGQLASEVRTISRSADPAARVRRVGRDEITSLTDEINTMLATLYRSKKELDRSREALEERVTERTAELAKTNEQLVAEIDERRLAEARLAHMASHDHLTGLHNRARFEEELELQIAHAERTGRGGAVLWLDVDHFKEINDSLGHIAGDEVLRALSERLLQQVRGDTLIARLGGDEFAFLLSDVDPITAQKVAQRLVDCIDTQPFHSSGHALHLSGSIGVVHFPEHAETLEQILALADLAMYHAKEQGRNRVCVYDPSREWREELHDRLNWAERIESALVNDRFELWAQRISSFSDPGHSRYELLIRMRDDQGGIVAPGAFLPVAERLGSIRAIDRWVVASAIDLLAIEKAEGRDTRVDVNISGRSFTDPDLLPLVQRKLEEMQVDPARLGIEITETAAILDLGKAREFIDQLNGIGCRFALDDFGSGFSSFAYLRELPIDSLKIDGSYIQRLATSPQDQHMVKAMVELAKGLGVSTVAEFVEDGETMRLLTSYGVDFGQGYYIHKPRPTAEVFESNGLSRN